MQAGETTELSARERQIMDALYRRGEATVAAIREDLPDPPSASAVRTMLLRLEEKGHLVRRDAGGRNVYAPTTPREDARRSALDRLVETFFDGSSLSTMAALLERADAELSEDELEELMRMIDEARERGR